LFGGGKNQVVFEVNLTVPINQGDGRTMGFRDTRSKKNCDQHTTKPKEKEITNKLEKKRISKKRENAKQRPADRAVYS